MTYIRKGNDAKNDLIVICNFTPVVRENYRIGIPKKGELIELFNSDAKLFGGSGVQQSGKLKVEATPYDGRDYSIALTLPPLAISVFKMK
jgi:1,4-alpha-glucan branching enzyme